MEDAKKKDKENAEEEQQPSLNLTLNMTITTTPTRRTSDLPSLDLNLPPSSNKSPPPAPCTSSSSAQSSSTEPELIQEAKRLKLAPDQQNTQDSSSSNPKAQISISSIPPASRRPFYNRRKGRPPRPPSRAADLKQTQLTIGLPDSSDPIDLAQQAKRDLNPAQLRIHVPEERARANFKLARQRAKKGRVDWVDPVMITRTRPGPSPLGLGPAPYDMVKQVLSNVKEFLNRFLAKKNASKKSQPPSSALVMVPPLLAQQLSAHATWKPASLSSSQSIAPPSALSTSSPPTVEQVMHMLDEYVETIPKTASAREMEDKLQEFQTRVKVDPLPTWYALMTKSSLDFFDNLTEYFVCEALESDPEEDDDDDPTEEGTPGSGSSS